MSSPGFHILIYDWLQPLLQRLREKGLPVSPDSHLQVLKVFQLCGEKITDGESLFHYLSPVLAKNEEQVKILKETLRGFLEEQFPQAEPAPETTQIVHTKPEPKPKWKKWIWAAAVVPLLIVLYFIWPRYEPGPVRMHAEVNFSDYSKPVTFDASGSFNNLKDTQNVQFVWSLGDGTIDSSGHVVQHTYIEPGLYPISVTVSSSDPKINISKADTAWELKLCSRQPKIVTDVSDIRIGQVVKFTLDYDSLYPPNTSNTWYVNEKAVLSNSYTLVDSFSTPGPQVIEFSEGVQVNKADCNSYAEDLTVTVKSPQDLAISFTGNTALPQPDSSIRSAWLWLLGLLILLPASIAAYIKRKLAKKDRASKATANAIIKQFSGRGSPWEIPFKNHDELVEDEQGIAQLSKLYKRRSQAETYYLNVAQTISSTIRSEGLLQPVYSSASRPLEFLILIDKTKVKSQQVKLFEYLVTKFSRNDIYLEKFYFQSTPEICTNANYPNGVHISRLHDLYSGHTLILFGNGYQFLEPHYPALKDPLVRYFKKWNSRAICTPVSYADWNYRERLLQQAGAVFPADLKGQLLLFRVLEQSDLLQDDFRKYIDDAYGAKSWNFTSTAQLSAYLNSPFLYQWLCAMAVYPHIDWNVMVAIGDALQAKHFRGHTMNYSSLLKLVRISWMADGTWPDNLRLELLKDLEPAHEKTARETMVRILEEAASKVKPSSAVYEQIQTQLIINKFLLHAHDPANEKYRDYAVDAGQFKSLWEQEKIMDVTLAGYLKKPGGDAGWPTLINNNNLSGEAGDSLTIDRYLKDGVHVLKRRLVPAQTGLLATSVLAVSMLVLILTTGFRDTAVGKMLNLSEAGSKVTVLLEAETNDCFDVDRMRSDQTRFILSLPDGEEVILKAGTLSRSIQIPYAWTDSSLSLSVRSNDAKYNLFTLLKINSNKLTLGISGCPSIVPTCRSWTDYSLNGSQFQNSYAGDWYEQIVRNKQIYQPVHVEPGYVNGKKIVKMFTCPASDEFYKLILSNTDGGYQVVYVKENREEQLSDFSFIGERFSSVSAAEKDTSNPGFNTLVRHGKYEDFVAEPLSISGLEGKYRLADNGPNAPGGEIELTTINGAPSFILNNSSYRITNMEKPKEERVGYIHKLTLRDPQRGQKIVFIINNLNEILYSENTPAPGPGINAATPSIGTFYAAARTDKTAQYTRINIDDLPPSLNEIWYSYGDPYMNIKLANKIIYYASNNPEQVSGFPISEAYSSGNETYKLISQSGNGFRVIFIRNITSEGFEVSMCNSTYRTAVEAEAIDENVCNQFRSMIIYYPNTSYGQKILVPVDAVSYEKGEAEKIKRFTSVPKNSIRVDSLLVYLNAKGRSQQELANRYAQIRRNSELNTFGQNVWYSFTFDGNMFERDYITVKLRPVFFNPDCNTTFTSMDEVQKLSSPLIVCRLNLSSARLTQLPREIYDFTNLQYLNLGVTTIPEATLDDLRRRFGKLDLQYTRPETETELLSIVIRSDQFTENSEKMVIDIAGKLAADRNKKIRIEGDYYNEVQLKQIQLAITNTTNLLYKNKVNRQYNQVTEKLNDRRKEQTTAAGPTLRIIGINYDGPGQSNPTGN